jgi:hypothetical protein
MPLVAMSVDGRGRNPPGRWVRCRSPVTYDHMHPGQRAKTVVVYVKCGEGDLATRVPMSQYALRLRTLAPGRPRSVGLLLLAALLALAPALEVLGAGAISRAGEPMAAVEISSQGVQSRVEELAREWLRKAERGRDRPGALMLTQVQTMKVGVPPNAPDYVARREYAFRSASDQARQAIAGQLGAKIKADLKNETLLRQVVGDRELARALVGFAATDREGAVKFERELSSLVEVAAQASLRGFSLVQTFELVEGEQAAVAVVAALSAQSQSWAKDGGTDEPDRQSIEGWFADMPVDVLSRTYGTRFVADQAGKMHVVAFGRELSDAEANIDDDARRSAGSAADGLAGLALATVVEGSSWSRSVSRTTRLQDLGPEWLQVKAFNEKIKASTGGAGVRARIRQLPPRKIRDPIAGRDMWVAVSVVALGEHGPESRVQVSGCPEVPPEMAKAVRQVDARGEGASYDDAVRSALRDAIRQEGVFIESNQELRREFAQQMTRVNDEVNRKSDMSSKDTERTRTFADGFIHSYAVTRKGPLGGGNALVEVEICANIVRFDPDDPRFGGVPTIAVLPAMVRGGAVKVNGRAVDGGSYARSIESAVERCLADAPKCYKLLDVAGAAPVEQVRDSIRARAGQGQVPPQEMMKLGRQLTADFVALIEIDRLEFTGQAGNFPQIGIDDVAVAQVRCRIVNVSDGSVVPWSASEDVRLGYSDGLPLPSREPEEQSMAPIDVALHRAERGIARGLREFLGLPARGSSPGVSGAVPASVRVIRVSRTEVSLDASHPLVRIGAKFAVENPVSVTVGGRVLIDRDRVAVIQVTSVRDGIAKARAIDGDVDLIDAVSCEVTPVP